jgi:hypothetical protein
MSVANKLGERVSLKRSLSLLFGFLVIGGIHAYYLYLVIYFLSEMGRGYVSMPYYAGVGFWGMFAILLIMFAPLVYGILEMAALFRLDDDKAGKLFLGAEIPIIFFSFIFLTQSSLPSAILLYVIALVAIVALTLRLVSKEKSILPKWLDTILALVGAGIFSYLAVVWVVFIPFLVYLPVAFFDAAGNIFYDFSAGEIFGFVLALLGLFAVYYMPFYSIFLYWRQLGQVTLQTRFGLSERWNSLVWRLAGLVLVFCLGAMLNPSIYMKGFDTLALKNKTSYETVISGDTESLTKLFVSTYRKEKAFSMDRSDIQGMLPSCGGKDTTFGCKAYDSVLNAVLLPFVYQKEKLMPYGSSDVEELLQKVFENEIPKSIDVTAIRQAVYELDRKWSGDVYEKLTVSPIREQTESKFVILKTIDVTTTALRAEGLQQTELFLEFRNTQRSLQEAQLLLKLPDGAVVTDLVLGKNLELPSLVGPEGAADRVYTRSIQRRIDPAVLAKLGPSIYSLKVYPIFVTTFDAEVAQKVKIAYVAPLTSRIVLPVIQNLRNTDIGYDSIVQGKISFPGKISSATSETALVETPVTSTALGQQTTTVSWKFDIFASYMGAEHVISVAEKITPYCLEKPVFSESAVVYLDTSYSAHENLAMYKKLFAGLFTKYSQVDVFEYNHEISSVITLTDTTAAQQYLQKLVFWGSSSDEKVRDLVFAAATNGADVYAVLDENTFEQSSQFKTQYHYDKVDGKWNVVAVGGYKAPVNELGNAAAATNGVSTSVDTLLADWEVACQTAPVFAGTSGAMAQTITEKMKLVRANEAKLLEVSDNDSFVATGRKMYVVAGRNHFVDSLNSFIAVETEEQRRQLREEAEKYGAFETGPDTVTPTGIIFRDFNVGSSESWAPNSDSSDSSRGLFALPSSGYSKDESSLSGDGWQPSGVTSDANDLSRGLFPFLVFGVVPGGIGIYFAARATRKPETVTQEKEKKT